jgi:hypothetical protein
MRKWIYRVPIFLFGVVALATSALGQAPESVQHFSCTGPFQGQEACVTFSAQACLTDAEVACGGSTKVESYSCESCGYYESPRYQAETMTDTCPLEGQADGWYARLWYTCVED